MILSQAGLLYIVQCLSNQVANTAVYVLIGAVPIYMMIERNMLSLLMNIIRNNTTVEYQILMCQPVFVDTAMIFSQAGLLYIAHANKYSDGVSLFAFIPLSTLVVP
jgi:hypothetical protein